MKKLIAGIVGPIGVGKTAVANYLALKGYCHFRYSEPIEEEIKKQGLPLTRANYQNLGDAWRKDFGPDYLSRLLFDKIDSVKGNVILEGIRNPAELKLFRERDNFCLVGLTAGAKVRFQRLKERGQPQDPKTWEEFLVQEKRDQGLGQPEYGQNVAGCLELADTVIETKLQLALVCQQVEYYLERKLAEL
jgi:dephospho-CoA kinase